MNVEIKTKNNQKIAAVQSEELIITDTSSALDFISTISYQHECWRIALNKEAITEEFFRLSTGLAGEILQKFVNYNITMAIYGDYSGYTSKPLKDFIYESNKGSHIFFVSDLQEALNMLGD